MATLTNPINAQNIVDRFADYVVATANANIVYHSTNKPFPEFDAALLGVDTGRTIAVTGSSITPSGSAITASNIYNTLVAETNRYTNIRKTQFQLVIGLGAGNKTREATDAVNVTAKAHLAGTTHQGDVGSPANAGVASGQTVDDTNLETFFTNLRSAYQTTAENTTYVDGAFAVTVCHQSCHSSCHGARGRR